MKPTPRSVGRYRSGAALIAGLAGLVATLGVLASPGDASPKVDVPVSRGPLRIGMNSCAARGCHGAVDATDPAGGQVYIKDGAYTTWLHYDPHARAYAGLLEPRSVAMARRLKATLGGKPAHEAGLCLSCHSTPEPRGPEEVVTASDGISCEACHGPAEVWRDKHLSPAWRTLAALPIVKDADGMINLGSATARARSCVGCHVGDRLRGMDVNHDLIAAGHPRLNFEFASYLATYPKHWKVKDASAGAEAKSWAIGQVVTAEAVLDLLAARALASEQNILNATWPEFSEYECFACHHDLTSPSPRQVTGGNLGRLPWQTWASAMLPELAKDRPGVDLALLEKLKAEMALSEPDAKKVADLASQARRQLDDLLRALEAGGLGPAAIDAYLNHLASQPASEGWDRASQRYLALLTLARAAKASGLVISPAVEAAIRNGSESLDFPTGFDSPRRTSKGTVPAQSVR